MLINKELLSIGEVAEMTGVAVHTLRYWESEFGDYFSPIRTKGRQRRYSENEVKKILEIKRLLKVDKYSIAGAKQILASRRENGDSWQSHSQDGGNGNGNGNGQGKPDKGMADAALRLTKAGLDEFFSFQSAHSR